MSPTIEYPPFSLPFPAPAQGASAAPDLFLPENPLNAYDSPKITTDVADEDAPPAHTPEEIKAAALAVLVDQYRRAQPLMADWHTLWDQYYRFYAGEWSDDLSTESAILNQIYIPKLAEQIDFANAGEIAQMMPDPQSMDFVGIRADWPGLEEEAEDSEALLRQKLRIMRPEDAPSLFLSALNIKQDLRVAGNTVALITHDIFSGDADGDEVSEGPCLARIDPRNWFPHSVTVDDARQCAHTIYAPLSEDDAERIPYLDVEDLRRTLMAREFQRTDNAQPAGTLDGRGQTASGPGDFGWRRWATFGPLPWRAIAEKLGEGETWTREDVVAALAGVFEFERDDGQWWLGEWVEDEYLITLKPYPLDLPAGCGPVVHAPHKKINGQLIGRGVYDTSGWMERLYNEYNRLLLQLGRFAAEPPILENDDMLDEDWLAEHEGADSFLQPGERVRLRSGLATAGVTLEPFKLMEMNVGQAIVAIQGLMDRVEAQMRADTQVTQDYTGQSGAKTATQAMNNLSQSRGMESHNVKLGENGWLLEIVQRCCVVMRQVLRLRGEAVTVPVSAGEKKLRVATIDPDAIRGMSYFTITVNGSSAPSSKIYQVQQLTQLLAVLIPIADRYGIEIPWFVRTILDSSGIRGKDQAFRDVTDVETAIANVTALMGSGGMDLLPPNVQAQIQRLMQQTIASAGAQGMLPAPEGQGQGNGTGAAPGGNGMSAGGGMGQGALSQPPLPGLAPVEPPMPARAPGLTGVY